MDNSLINYYLCISGLAPLRFGVKTIPRKGAKALSKHNETKFFFITMDCCLIFIANDSGIDI